MSKILSLIFEVSEWWRKYRQALGRKSEPKPAPSPSSEKQKISPVIVGDNNTVIIIINDIDRD